MSKIPTFILAAHFAVIAGFAQERVASTSRSAPEDIVQASIQFVRLATNSFTVQWTYTVDGAKKAMAAWETVPKHQVISSEWRTDWLKHRTDKCFFTNETAAAEFMQRIKGEFVVLPTDVVQDSIWQIEFSKPATNLFAVRWIYTEAGARRALAAWEIDGSHHGLNREFKKSWLEYPIDKEFFQTKAAAEQFAAKLRNR